MATEKFQTLHPKNQSDVNVYPNVKNQNLLEKIPATKLDFNVWANYIHLYNASNDADNNINLLIIHNFQITNNNLLSSYMSQMTGSAMPCSGCWGGTPIAYAYVSSSSILTLHLLGGSTESVLISSLAFSVKVMEIV